MIFAHPQYFWLLLLVVVLLGVWAVGLRLMKKREQQLADAELLAALSPERSRWRPTLKYGLMLLAVIVLIIVLARPQTPSETATTDSRKGIEAIIMVDVSNSMLATDVTPTRLERSKLLVSTLIDRMKNDKVGLGIFAGEAYPLLPITNDYVSAKMFLDGIQTGAVSLQGTNLGDAITLASSSFTQDKHVGKAIIIITDGENHEEGAKEAAEKARKQGRHVYVLGVGSTQGSEINIDGQPLVDGEGQVVKTALNEQMCREVAQAGGGTYIHVDNSNVAQDQLQQTLSHLQKSESRSTTADSMGEQFQAWALIALILLILEFCIMQIQNPLLARFGRKPQTQTQA